MILRSLALITLITFSVVGIDVEKLRGKYTKEDISDYYQITVPKKISEDGEFITHYLPHFYDNTRSKRHLQGDSVNYLVTIDSIDHHLQLWPSIDFIAPGLVVEHHAANAKDNISNIVIRQSRSNRCYFNGIIRGVPNSKAILSTCDGLAGSIRTGNGDYLIEPIHDNDRPMVDEQQLHLIHKRSPDRISNETKTNCGTKGSFKEALNDRLKWENMYGKAVENSVKSSTHDYLIRTKKENTQVTRMPNNERLARKCTETTTESECCPPTDDICLSESPLYLEVMVAIDHRIDRSWIGIDVETYIMSIMNMVASNLFDGSIGKPIKLNVVRVILLTFAYPQLDILRYSPLKLLHNFCQWQMNFNPLNENHPNHHDFAIFVTRFEPCQGHIFGVTYMASICRPDKSCAVVSDEGLLLANIITHQIGHSLGADHDEGTTGGCAPEEPDGTIYHMGAMMSMSSSEWSSCSRSCISDFVSTHVGWCLNDLPSMHDFTKPFILPGQIYSPIQQCSINFNMKTMACRVGEFCKMLYCQISPTQCATTGDPPAAGTPCAMNMWCFHGDCVQRGYRPGAINGEWGPWTHWSPCTRTCGGGVQSRHRACNDPAPQHGGKFCKGEFISFKMCSTNDCVGFSQGFAQLQCKLTDKRLYNGKVYSWNHFEHFFDDVGCALVCINEKQQVAVRSAVVIDGTPCKPGTKNVCIQGTCMDVGCDWVINSNSKSDACGVCHGNGTSCRVVQGYYGDANVSTGLVPFLKLPAGTSMIFVRELNPTKCSLVVTSSVNSSFYLNSVRGEETLPGLVNIAGTTGVYETRASIERLLIPGGIRGPITLNMMCEDGKTRGVRYQYALPEFRPHYAPKFSWEFVYWTRCELPCGGGAQRAIAICVEANSGEVEDKYCASIQKPDDIIRACNEFPCLARWWAGPWSDCDCSNGEGIQTRVVLCLRDQAVDAIRTKIVKEKECCNQPKPRVEKACSVLADVTYYETTTIGRDKRQMKKLRPHNEKDDLDLVYNPPRSMIPRQIVLKTPLSVDNNFKDYQDKVEMPLVTKKINKQINQGIYLGGNDKDAMLDYAFNKGSGKDSKANFHRRHKKLIPSNHAKSYPRDLSMDDEVTSSNSQQRRQAHRTRLLTGNMHDMSNHMEKENPGHVKNFAKKAAETQDRKSIGYSPYNNKILHLEEKGHHNLTNNTFLVLRPIGGGGITMKFIRETTSSSITNEPKADGSKGNIKSAAPTRKSSDISTCKLNNANAEMTTKCALKVVPTPTRPNLTCDSTQSYESEPAELPGWLESANASSYKLILSPIEPMIRGYPETDAEFQILGTSGLWPIADEGNQLTLFGQQVLEALLEAKRRATKPPRIDVDIHA